MELNSLLKNMGLVDAFASLSDIEPIQGDGTCDSSCSPGCSSSCDPGCSGGCSSTKKA